MTQIESAEKEVKHALNFNFPLSSAANSSSLHQATTSRIPGFAKMSARGRVSALAERLKLSAAEVQVLLSTGALPLEIAENFIENCIGGFTLPLGVATNFLIDGQEVLIPMAVEESSVVAAASHGAKLARSGGGFFSTAARSVATCQIQFKSEITNVFERFSDFRSQIHQIAENCHPRLLGRGGGVLDVELRALSKPGNYVIHIHVDTCEAMGANIVNTMAEEVGRHLPTLLPCAVGLRILTNLTVHRVTKVSCFINPASLAMGGFSGEEAVDRICSAWEFADLDPFRAATHNKGVMNGIDPVVIATGNDWRAVEAGCHAFASLSGQYKPLTQWSKRSDGFLEGNIAVPIAVGTVGGVTQLHPSAAAALRIMGNPNSHRLACLIASVGLAQNLSALRALACEGIQKGHMALHDKNIEMMRRYDHMPQLSAVHQKTPISQD